MSAPTSNAVDSPAVPAFERIVAAMDRELADLSPDDADDFLDLLEGEIGLRLDNHHQPEDDE